MGSKSGIHTHSVQHIFSRLLLPLVVVVVFRSVDSVYPPVVCWGYTCVRIPMLREAILCSNTQKEKHCSFYDIFQFSQHFQLDPYTSVFEVVLHLQLYYIALF